MSFNWIGQAEDGLSVHLKHISAIAFPTPSYYNEEWVKTNADKIKVAAILDTETSGTNPNQDEIIELGIRLVEFNRETGEILRLGEAFNQRQEPRSPISSEITMITGLTNEDLVGQSINWSEVEAILDKVVLVIAHNAKFDRGFVDLKSSKSRKTIWACSMVYVDWFAKGYISPKLELLNVYHGFYTGSHRALNDCDALAYLLTFKQDGKPYLAEVLEHARTAQAKSIAFGSPFESKDVLKARGYQWNVEMKVWAKVIKESEHKDELKWLSENVYHGAVKAQISKIASEDTFKDQ